MPIYKAIIKYGYLNFKLEIFQYCNTNNILEKKTILYQ